MSGSISRRQFIAAMAAVNISAKPALACSQRRLLPQSPLYPSPPSDVAWSGVLVGDFDGDGVADIAALEPYRHWWLGLSLVHTFPPEHEKRFRK